MLKKTKSRLKKMQLKLKNRQKNKQLLMLKTRRKELLKKRKMMSWML